MLKNYFVVAVRNVLRNRVYTLLNVLGLALGLACGLIMFWLIRFQHSFDTFHKKIDNIYQVTSIFKSQGGDPWYSTGVPPHMSKAIREDIQGAKATMCMVEENLLFGIQDKNGKIVKKFKEVNKQGAYVEPVFFDIFTIPWQIGTPNSLKAPNKIALSEKTAKLFFGNENPLGKTVIVQNSLLLEVVGIFKEPQENTDMKNSFYISFATLEANKNANYGVRSIYNQDGKPIWDNVNSDDACYALLPASLSEAQIKIYIESITKKYHPKDYKTFVHDLLPLRLMHLNKHYVSKGVPPHLLWILGSVGAFLVITACFNFINMATAQAMRRAKEVGVRKALGGGKWEIFYQFMTETAIVVLFAMFFGVLLGASVLPYMNIILHVEVWQSAIVWADITLWLDLLLIFVAVTLMAGMYPAMILANFKPIMALRGSVSTRQIGGISLRRLLIVFQFVLIQVLLMTTLVMNQQIDYMLGKDLGFTVKGIYDFNVPTPDSINQQTFKKRVLEIAGIEKISLRSAQPMSGNVYNASFQYDKSTKDMHWSIGVKNIDENYLDLYNLRIIAGENIPASDTLRGFLVNERFLERMGIANPKEVVGKSLKVWDRQAKIYGVVRNFHDQSLRNSLMPLALFSAKSEYKGASILLNIGQFKEILPKLQKLWDEYFPNQVFQGGFLDKDIEKHYEEETALLTVVRGCSWIAIVIGCLGLYGLVRFLAVQKTKEIGIRKAYGATVSQILYLFGTEIFRLILIGFMMALPLSFFLMWTWLQSYVHRIDLGAHIGFVAVLALLITSFLAIVTILYEAYKASQKSPSLSLKTE